MTTPAANAASFMPPFPELATALNEQFNSAITKAGEVFVNVQEMVQTYSDQIPAEVTFTTRQLAQGAAGATAALAIAYIAGRLLAPKAEPEVRVMFIPVPVSERQI